MSPTTSDFRADPQPMTLEDRKAWLATPVVQNFLKTVEAAASFKPTDHGESLVLEFSPRSKLASILGGELEYANTRDQYNSLTTILFYPGERNPFTVHKYDRIVYVADGYMELTPQMGKDYQTFLIHKTAGTAINCLCDPSFVACVDPSIRRYILPSLE